MAHPEPARHHPDHRSTTPSRTPRSRSLIVVVDDDPTIQVMLEGILQTEGYDVVVFDDAEAALGELDRLAPSLVLLDIELPGMSGLDALRMVRTTNDVPVIMLTGRDAEIDRVLGLELGADDYVGKPFGTRELVSRVKAILRRVEAAPAAPTGPADIELHALRVSPTSREVAYDGTGLVLTAREFDLLAHLAANPRQAFTRRELLEAVWQSSPEWQSEDTVTEHVRRIRGKLVDAGASTDWITTVRGVGYRFDPQPHLPVPLGAGDLR